MVTKNGRGSFWEGMGWACPQIRTPSQLKGTLSFLRRMLHSFIKRKL